MRSRAIAVWIFERLGVDVALAGDLLEERARGRSVIWFWSEVLVASGIRIATAIWAHKLLAARAVATGCAVNTVWIFLWLKFLPISVPAVPSISLHTVAALSIVLFTQFVTGWIVARTHRAHSMPMVILFTLWLSVWYLGADFTEIKRLLVASIDQPRFRPYLAWRFAPISFEIAGLLLGGLVGAGRKRPVDERPQCLDRT